MFLSMEKKYAGFCKKLLIWMEKIFSLLALGLISPQVPLLKMFIKQQTFIQKQKKRPTIREMNDQIISSYEKFFANLSSYKYMDFIKKAESIATK